MAVIIEWNNKSILQCQNRIIGALYHEIARVIQKDNIALNFHLEELMWHLDEWCSCGIGIDICEYIYSKEDFELFLKILKKALDRLDDNYYAKEWLKNFYHELIKIYETFEPDPLLVTSFKMFDFFVKHPEYPAAAIRYNRKYLLICPSELFCLLFDDILPNILHTNNISLPNNISELIKGLLIRRASSTDISNYTNSKEEVIFFTDLMRKIIDAIYKQYPTDAQYCAEFYETFYKNLLETIENFPYFTLEESKFTTSEIINSRSKKRMDNYYLKNNIIN